MDVHGIPAILCIQKQLVPCVTKYSVTLPFTVSLYKY